MNNFSSFNTTSLYRLREANGELLENADPLPELGKEIIFFVTDPYLDKIGQTIVSRPMRGEIIRISKEEENSETTDICFAINPNDGSIHVLKTEAIRAYIYATGILK